MAAGTRVAELKEQIGRFRPGLVSVADPGDAAKLAQALGPDGPRVTSGAEGLRAVASAEGTDRVTGLPVMSAIPIAVQLVDDDLLLG